MNTKDNQISSVWSTAFLNSSNIIEAFGPYVNKRYTIIEYFLKNKDGYIELYSFSREYINKVREVQSKEDQTLFEFAARHHEDPESQQKLEQYLSQLINKKYPYLSPQKLNVGPDIINILCREDLNVCYGMYSVITELIKKEFNDSVILKIQKTKTIFGEFSKKIYNVYTEQHDIDCDPELLTKKKNKIMKTFQVQLSYSSVYQPNEEKVHTLLEKKFLSKHTSSKHYRAILCYDIIDTIHEHLLKKDMNLSSYSTYLFYIYLEKKTIETWMSNFFSGKDTLVGDKELPNLIQVMLRISQGYQETTKDHPEILQKRNSQREFERKLANIKSGDLYETIQF